MANINQIQVGSTVYDIEDQTARNSISNLADVASSGDYGDLSNKPTIPSVVKYTAAVTVAGWSGSDPCTNVITVSGLKTTDTIIMDLTPSSTYATSQDEAADYAAVYKAVCTANNKLTLYANKTPEHAFNVQLVCMR